MEISSQLQQEIAQFQQLQEQYQLFSAQRAQMEFQFRELEGTLEKLSKVDDATPLYQDIGSILVRVKEKNSLVEELNEKKETLSRRVQSMKQQEERLKQRLESMGTELNKKLQGAGIA